MTTWAALERPWGVERPKWSWRLSRRLCAACTPAQKSFIDSPLECRDWAPHCFNATLESHSAEYTFTAHTVRGEVTALNLCIDSSFRLFSDAVSASSFMQHQLGCANSMQCTLLSISVTVVPYIRSCCSYRCSINEYGTVQSDRRCLETPCNRIVWETNSKASQQSPCILWNPVANYSVHTSPPIVLTPSKINPVHTRTSFRSLL